MTALGLRVTPTIVFFAIIRTVDNDYKIEIIDKIIIPVALRNIDKLSYIHNVLYTIIYEYNIDSAILRRIEDNAQTLNIFRINIEGVIQELISNCRVTLYDACKLSQLGVILKIDNIKDCVDGCINQFEIDRWELYKGEERESILCSLAALNLQEQSCSI